MVRKYGAIGVSFGGVRPTQGELLQLIEDVGGHNAVDAVVGKMWLDASKKDE